MTTMFAKPKREILRDNTREYKEYSKNNSKEMAKKINEENMQILESINIIQLRLKTLHQNYQYATDPKLIDSCIYEMSALYSKYDYYVKLCKEKGIVVTTITSEVM